MKRNRRKPHLPRPGRHVRFGEEQEAMVSVYQNTRDGMLLEEIIKACEGIFVAAWARVRPGMPYREFWSYAAEQVLSGIETFDRSKGSGFAAWMAYRVTSKAVSLLRTGIRRNKTYILKGSLQDVASKEDLDRGEHEDGPGRVQGPRPPDTTAEAAGSRVGHENLVRIIRHNKLRFHTPVERGLCNFILDRLIEDSKWPSITQIADKAIQMGGQRSEGRRMLSYLRFATIRTLEARGYSGDFVE